MVSPTEEFMYESTSRGGGSNYVVQAWPLAIEDTVRVVYHGFPVVRDGKVTLD